jgi:hypothetical protein
MIYTSNIINNFNIITSFFLSSILHEDFSLPGCWLTTTLAIKTQSRVLERHATEIKHLFGNPAPLIASKPLLWQLIQLEKIPE